MYSVAKTLALLTAHIDNVALCTNFVLKSPRNTTPKTWVIRDTCHAKQTLLKGKSRTLLLTWRTKTKCHQRRSGFLWHSKGGAPSCSRTCIHYRLRPPVLLDALTTFCNYLPDNNSLSGPIKSQAVPARCCNALKEVAGS